MGPNKATAEALRPARGPNTPRPESVRKLDLAPPERIGIDMWAARKLGLLVGFVATLETTRRASKTRCPAWTSSPRTRAGDKLRQRRLGVLVEQRHRVLARRLHDLRSGQHDRLPDRMGRSLRPTRGLVPMGLGRHLHPLAASGRSGAVSDLNSAVASRPADPRPACQPSSSPSSAPAHARERPPAP